MGFRAECPMPTCGFQVTAVTKEDVIKQFMDHAKTTHSLSSLDLEGRAMAPSEVSRLSFHELTQPKLCEQCGGVMLESDYDYYCVKDNLLIKKQSTPPIPQFLENETVVKLLEPGWSGHFKIGDVPQWPEPGESFADAILTNQRLMFLNRLGTVLALGLDLVRVATVQSMKPIVDTSILIVSMKQNVSISIVLSRSWSVIERREETEIERGVGRGHKRKTFPLSAAARTALALSEFLARPSDDSSEDQN